MSQFNSTAARKFNGVRLNFVNLVQLHLAQYFQQQIYF